MLSDRTRCFVYKLNSATRLVHLGTNIIPYRVPHFGILL